MNIFVMRSLVVASLLLGITAGGVFAQSKILINEFLIDPQPQQVEIINDGAESADLSGWIIDDSCGTTFYTIPQSSILYPNSCLVFSGDFNLNKTSADTIRLINNTELIDSFSYKLSSGSGISYFRLPDGENNWTTGSANLGLFNFSKLSCLITPTPIPTEIIFLSPTLTPGVSFEPTEIPEPMPASYNNIFINEVMVNPESGGNEWVELYNNNDFTVSLTNWYIDDIENSGSTPKTFSLEIPAKEYRVFNLSSSIFNNDSDNIRLLDFNKFLKDSFEYGSSTQGKTWGRIDLNNDNFCLQEPSYETTNNPCLNPTSNPTPSSIKTLTLTKTTIFTNKSTVKPLNYNVSTLPAGRQVYHNRGNVLGISTNKTNNDFLLIHILSFISLSYSLLVVISVLIKNKILNKYVLAS